LPPPPCRLPPAGGRAERLWSLQPQAGAGAEGRLPKQVQLLLCCRGARGGQPCAPLVRAARLLALPPACWLRCLSAASAACLLLSPPACWPTVGLCQDLPLLGALVPHAARAGVSCCNCRCCSQHAPPCSLCACAPAAACRLPPAAASPRLLASCPCCASAPQQQPPRHGPPRARASNRAARHTPPCCRPLPPQAHHGHGAGTRAAAGGL
jgi:hypothetical protein